MLTSQRSLKTLTTQEAVVQINCLEQEEQKQELWERQVGFSGAQSGKVVEVHSR